MTIQSLYDAGRLPHAVLFIGGAECENEVTHAIKLHNCASADTIRVKETMPPSDSEKKSGKPSYSYKIDALRGVIGAGNLRPQFGDTRVFVFKEFDTMSEVCQNALLKFIEEPREYNRFVMTARSTSKILPTILSRVVVIRQQDVNSGNIADSGEHQEWEIIAKAVTEALISKNEYGIAAAFSRVKDRQMLGGVLQLLTEELCGLMRTADNPAVIIEATDVIRKYAKRMEVNPNIQVTVTSCAAELYCVL
ncbi:MAG: hypothetical protein FWH07_01950 [Oscillospiraceae bacterium]|nr:hypothetical protein [Oscillospiraceae bacterium]